ncbi:Inactive heparanase-2 [Crenichthys baileyi]|uniref:Inactive heparanase-2 n=1 Tax=Crenichthys baileyi TaxID=28760 RepID=A0AAV9RTB2_9TELE
MTYCLLTLSFYKAGCLLLRSQVSRGLESLILTATSGATFSVLLPSTLLLHTETVVKPQREEVTGEDYILMETTDINMSEHSAAAHNSLELDALWGTTPQESMMGKSAYVDSHSRSLDKLYNFADCAGLHLILGLNGLQRNPDNSWNTSSTLSLLKYGAGKKYNISWELGNEPNAYRSMVGRAVNSTQLSQDYAKLRTLLQSVRYYNRAHLYGPNAGRPRKNAVLLLDGFMKNAGSVIDAVTWQHYFMDGRVKKAEDFLKTRLLDTLTEQITKVTKVVNTHTPGKKVWLGGLGPAWAGGNNNLSETYAASFLWMNTLGVAAVQGIDVVLRHSFFDYGYTHLVDQHFNPLPDYWFSLVFKRLVGPRVLAVRVAGLQRKPQPGRVIWDKLRIYAHCTSYYNPNYMRGSITIYIINLHRSRKKIKLAGTLRNRTIHQYLLQPHGEGGLRARHVQLNGEKLLMGNDETFPDLKPKILRAGRTIAMPPMTIGFYVIKNINAYACRR